MGMRQTQAFRDFVRGKRIEVSDALCLFENCIRKLDVLEDYLMLLGEDGSDLDRISEGLGCLLKDVNGDLRLLLAEWQSDVFKNRRPSCK